MALQIANPVVVSKIETLARVTGLSKTAAVEAAVDRLLTERNVPVADDIWKRFDALLEQIDRIPDVEHPIDPLEWDEQGLPR
jgi:antitoxin VapB